LVDLKNIESPEKPNILYVISLETDNIFIWMF
jgi:hypothetical protein